MLKIIKFLKFFLFTQSVFDVWRGTLHTFYTDNAVEDFANAENSSQFKFIVRMVGAENLSSSIFKAILGLFVHRQEKMYQDELPCDNVSINYIINGLILQNLVLLLLLLYNVNKFKKNNKESSKFKFGYRLLGTVYSISLLISIFIRQSVNLTHLCEWSSI
jgi:hypothetical protein